MSETPLETKHTKKSNPLPSISSSRPGVLSTVRSESDGLARPPPRKRLKTVEEEYQRPTEAKHVLDRPDTYVGNTNFETLCTWVVRDASPLPLVTTRTVTATPLPTTTPSVTMETTAPKVTSALSSVPSRLANTTQKSQTTTADDDDAEDADDADDANNDPPEQRVKEDDDDDRDTRSSNVKTSTKKSLAAATRLIRTSLAFVWKRIRFVPALLKLFDEILTNATDNFQRNANPDRTAKHHRMTQLKVWIRPETGEIVIWNNGKGLPVVIHKTEKMYVPELVFGEMRGGSNFDDTEERTTGGRNGLGAKLTNIWSTRFVVETQDKDRGLSYKQTWRNNMSEKSKPIIRSSPKRSDFTRVSFIPDYRRFAMNAGLDPDLLALLQKRVYDAAVTCRRGEAPSDGKPGKPGKEGIAGGGSGGASGSASKGSGAKDKSLAVYLNGTKIAVKHETAYMQLFETHRRHSDAASPIRFAVLTNPAANAATPIDQIEEMRDDDDDDDPTRQKTVTVPPPPAVAVRSLPDNLKHKGGDQEHQEEEEEEEAAAVKPKPIIERDLKGRWQIGVMPTDGTQFHQQSFVNGICTLTGGTHVEHVVRQIERHLHAALTKKSKGTAAVRLDNTVIRRHLFVYLNTLVINPRFDTQTKVKLVTPFAAATTKTTKSVTANAKAIAPAIVLSPSFLRRITRGPIGQAVLESLQGKADRAIQKGALGKKSDHPDIDKLDDAKFAGSRRSTECTIIFTEGDSAKGLAKSGISVLPRGYYGVFPLRGKLLNVQGATATQLKDNVEFQAILRIVGLKIGVRYTSLKQLRYGKVWIMADQDLDGSHIKGLLINMIEQWWPELLDLGFLCEFITPIVKVSKRGQQTISFYTLEAYEGWKVGKTGWTHKYYKGLGTSTAQEAKQYFSDLTRHVVPLRSEGATDHETIRMAFDPKAVVARRHCMNAYRPGDGIDYQSIRTLRYVDFIHKGLVPFWIASCARALPSMVDGLKVGQRKILFAAFRRRLVREIKVASLAGYVIEHAAYHHGEAALADTIIAMAQNFVGSNNINYFVPSGTFGTAAEGGKDAASPRYINTSLTPLTRVLFPEHMDAVLTYLTDDGKTIEPQWYLPILPAILFNGPEGQGTGHSTNWPPYNPRDVLRNQRRLLAGQSLLPLTPWMRGFQGTVAPNPALERLLALQRPTTTSTRTMTTTTPNAPTTHADLSRLSCGPPTVRRAPAPLTKQPNTAVTVSVPLPTANRSEGDPTKQGIRRGLVGGAVNTRGHKPAYIVTGCASKVNDETVMVTELPFGMALSKYKEKKLDAWKPHKSDLKKPRRKRRNSKSTETEADDPSSESSGSDSDEEKQKPDDTRSRRTGKKRNKATPVTIKRRKISKIVSYEDDSVDENHLRLVITLTGEQMHRAEGEGLVQYLGLFVRLPTTNLVAFDPEGKLQVYESIEQMWLQFHQFRLPFYERSKQVQLAELQTAMKKLDNQARFLHLLRTGTLLLHNVPQQQVLLRLQTLGFALFPPERKTRPGGNDEDSVSSDHHPAAEDEEDYVDKEEKKKKTPAKAKGKVVTAANTDRSADMTTTKGARTRAPSSPSSTSTLSSLKKGYHYLLGLELWAQMEEKIDELHRQCKSKRQEVQLLSNKTATDLWNEDLDRFEVGLDEFERAWTSERDGPTTTSTTTKTTAPSKRKRTPRVRPTLQAEPSTSVAVNGSSVVVGAKRKRASSSSSSTTITQPSAVPAEPATPTLTIKLPTVRGMPPKVPHLVAPRRDPH